ncbi:hypothetical protein GCM10011507_27320 [Edaphobacter acidisoli]|uniref:DUF4440 domain-containing protein n=2 Tax=Edaphobacter acidisoli TaxID=2040573 RepID=A0A916RZD8_9BACT|nr:hypothetical protein GCM10011507_27320 [Edaphobacter acidisoli]
MHKKYGEGVRTRYNPPMRILALLLVLTAAAQAQAPEPVEVVHLEQHLWKAMAEENFASVRKLFTPDFVEVDSHIAALDTLLITLQQCKLTDYELHDLQVRILGPDAAMTAYHAVATFDCGTEAKPDLHHFDTNDTTTWVRRSGTWLVQAHTETPAKP